MDKILRFCSASEKRGKAAAGIGGKRGSPLGRRQQYDSIVRIDSDTAVMPLSRGAIFRAAGAACFAVDEVRSYVKSALVVVVVVVVVPLYRGRPQVRKN